MLLIALLTTATLVGGWLLRPHGVTAGLEGGLFRLLLGLLVTLTALAPVAASSLATAWTVLIAVALAGMTHEVFRRRRAPLPGTRPTIPRLDALEWTCAAALAMMALTAAVRAWAPPVAPEALSVHFALAKEAVLEDRLGAHERHPLSNGMDLGHAARALLYLWKSTLTLTAWQALSAVLGVAALYALVRRMATRRAALLAAAGFAAMPAAITGPLLGGNDMLATAFVFTAMTALARWRQAGQSACGVLGGVLMGGACAAGPVGWLALPGWFLLAAMLGPRGAMRGLVYAGLPALAVGIAWWWAAAPAPAGLNGLEALRAWLALAATPPLNMMETAAAPAWQPPEGRWPFFPWDAIMRPSWFEGAWLSPGPLAIAVGLPALLWCGRDMRRLAVFALLLGLTVMVVHPSTRLVMPACALLIGVAAAAIERTPRIRCIGHAAFFVAIAYGLVLHAATATGPARVMTGAESPAEWRARHIPMAPAFAWCNTHCEEGVILSFDPRAFLLESPAFVNHPELIPLTSKTVAGQARWLRERGIRYVLYPEAVVRRNAAFRETGITTMAARWRGYRNHFIQRAAFEDTDGNAIIVFEVSHVDTPR